MISAIINHDYSEMFKGGHKKYLRNKQTIKRNNNCIRYDRRPYLKHPSDKMHVPCVGSQLFILCCPTSIDPYNMQPRGF